jgi:hypothetical protein
MILHVRVRLCRAYCVKAAPLFQPSGFNCPAVIMEDRLPDSRASLSVLLMCKTAAVQYVAAFGCPLGAEELVKTSFATLQNNICNGLRVARDTWQKEDGTWPFRLT